MDDNVIRTAPKCTKGRCKMHTLTQGGSCMHVEVELDAHKGCYLPCALCVMMALCLKWDAGVIKRLGFQVHQQFCNKFDEEN